MESMKQPWTGASSLSLQASQASNWPPGSCSPFYHAPRKTYFKFYLHFISVLYRDRGIELHQELNLNLNIQSHLTLLCLGSTGHFLYHLYFFYSPLSSSQVLGTLLQCSRNTTFSLVCDLLMFLCSNSTCFFSLTQIQNLELILIFYLDHPFIFKSL